MPLSSRLNGEKKVKLLDARRRGVDGTRSVLYLRRHRGNYGVVTAPSRGQRLVATDDAAVIRMCACVVVLVGWGGGVSGPWGLFWINEVQR